MLRDIRCRHQQLTGRHVEVRDEYSFHVVVHGGVAVDEVGELIEGFDDFLALEVGVGGAARDQVKDIAGGAF